MNTPKPKLPSLTFCRMFYSPLYHPAYNTRLFLDDKTHNLHLPTVARHASRCQTGLWWRVSPNFMGSRKVVVRRWCARRMRHAIREALKERRFDEQGMALAGKNLKGTLEVHTLDSIVKAGFEEVKGEAAMMVEHVAKVCQRNAEMQGDINNRNSGKSRMPIQPQSGKDRPLLRKTGGILPTNALSDAKSSKYQQK